MAYKIIDVEGIGPVYAEKLQTAGIKTTEEYLEKCATPAGRKALAEATDISPKLIHSGLKLKPNAKLQEFLGYALPAHVEAELKAQASRFSLPMFYDIFAHLNACDYELKKPKNFMDKELFLRSELLKLSSIIAKHSKH